LALGIVDVQTLIPTAGIEVETLGTVSRITQFVETAHADRVDSMVSYLSIEPYEDERMLFGYVDAAIYDIREYGFDFIRESMDMVAPANVFSPLGVLAHYGLQELAGTDDIDIPLGDILLNLTTANLLISTMLLPQITLDLFTQGGAPNTLYVAAMDEINAMLPDLIAMLPDLIPELAPPDIISPTPDNSPVPDYNGSEGDRSRNGNEHGGGAEDGEVPLLWVALLSAIMEELEITHMAVRHDRAIVRGMDIEIEAMIALGDILSLILDGNSDFDDMTDGLGQILIPLTFSVSVEFDYGNSTVALPQNYFRPGIDSVFTIDWELFMELLREEFPEGDYYFVLPRNAAGTQKLIFIYADEEFSDWIIDLSVFSSPHRAVDWGHGWANHVAFVERYWNSDAADRLLNVLRIFYEDEELEFTFLDSGNRPSWRVSLEAILSLEIGMLQEEIEDIIGRAMYNSLDADGYGWLDWYGRDISLELQLAGEDGVVWGRFNTRYDTWILDGNGWCNDD